jgi:PTS system ascorbate-specific IIA component
MISLLIVAHGTLGDSLIQCATHVLGKRPPALDSLDLTTSDDPVALRSQAQLLLSGLDTGEGVLILTDVFGATPCNTVCKLVEPGRVEAIAGVNLPMLLKALTYRNQGMKILMDKAVSGGVAGIFPIQPSQADHG